MLETGDSHQVLLERATFTLSLGGSGSYILKAAKTHLLKINQE